MPPRKIIHLHPDGNFSSNFVDPLILAERSRGYVSTIITSENASGISGKIIPYDLRLRNLPGIFLAFAKLCFLFAVQKPDLVVSHNTRSSMLPLFASWLMGVKSRLYFNHGVPFVGYKGFLRGILKLIEIINCTLATEIVTVSPDMRDLILSLKPSANITIIFNGSACGIDLGKYGTSLYSDSSFREDYGILEEDTVVVFIGRPERRKGFELVLRMWRDHFKDSSIKLILCGAQQSDALKFLKKLPPNIICMGFVKNLPEVLSKADGMILPSLHEGLSYAVLEALASNCLVMANDIDGVRNLVHNGHNGYLVKDNSVSDYVQLIFSLRTKTKEMLYMKSNALKTAKIFSRDRYLPAYLIFIERVVA
jgi:N,N'-diacetylbacillosaminyl-diphospho-undecaprenol alpha-1,3-N-acetylgalactosaminyltransferase